MRTLPLLLVTIGCVSQPALIGSLRPATAPLSLTAPPALARVVFVRGRNQYGADFKAKIFDTQTRQVWGRSVSDSAFAVNVEPGTYELCLARDFEGQDVSRRARAEIEKAELDVPTTRVELEAGKTYALDIRLWWPNHLEARPVIPRTDEHGAWLLTLSDVRAAEFTAVEVLSEEEAAPLIARCRGSSMPLEMNAGEGW